MSEIEFSNRLVHIRQLEFAVIELKVEGFVMQLGQFSALQQVVADSVVRALPRQQHR